MKKGLRHRLRSASMLILKVEGYWEKQADWRLFGDRENNFSTIGNQQSCPEAAAHEKLVYNLCGFAALDRLVQVIRRLQVHPKV